MITSLPPYPAYKDSFVRWLGQVPEHWEVRRLRNIVEMRVSNVDKHSKEGEQPVRLCNYVDVYKHERIRANMEFMKATASAEEIERFRLEQGDVLITKDSEAWDDIGVPALVESSAPDLISGYHLALLRPRQVVEGAFLLRTLQNPQVAYQFHVEATGVTRYGLSHDAIKSTSVPLPPLAEQTAIVRFLDYMDRRIRRYIRAKQKLIKLLEEYRQALIHQAVTGKIDVRTGKPYPAYKDSGVPWLGQVPQHWEVRRIKTLFRETDERNGDGSGPLLSLTRARGIVPQAEASNRIASVEDLSNYKVCKSGDLIMNRMQAWSGMFAVSGIDGVISPDYSVFKPKAPIDVHYFEALFKTPLLVEEFAKRSKGIGSGFNRLYTPDFGAVPIASPPLSEQTAIVEYLDAQTAKLDTAIATTRREIELLREYRTRLIADVVTGKVDVRQVAVQLPYEPPEEEAGTEEEEVAAEELATVDSQEEANGEE